MQRFSFDFGDPFFDIGGWHAALQFATFENTYGLDRTRTTFARGADSWRIECSGLTWAGGQETADGHARLSARRTADEGEITAEAAQSPRSRPPKLSVRG